MSTVDLNTANRVIAGDFPEDKCFAILRYENAFNGDYAYKLIFAHGCLNIETMAKHLCNTLYRINTGAPVLIFWCMYPEVIKFCKENNYLAEESYSLLNNKKGN